MLLWGSDIEPCYRLLVIAIMWGLARSKRLQSTWDTSEHLVMVVGKFGVQKTDTLHKKETRGYIYGNVTATNIDFGSPNYPHIFMVLADNVKYNSFQSDTSNNNTCALMLNNLSRTAYHQRCFKTGTQDYLRAIPCPPDQLCEGEDDVTAVQAGFQFTFQIQDTVKERQWFLLFVSCYLDEKCQWVHQAKPIKLLYDINMVNGNPNVKNSNPFEHQFSFDLQDVAEIYFIAFVLFCMIAALQLRAFYLSYNRRALLVLVILVMESTGLMLNSLNMIIYAVNGEGTEWLHWLGDVGILLGERLLVLLLVLLAHGWTIFRKNVAFFRILGLWSVYVLIFIILFSLNATQIDPIEDVDIFRTWPGRGLLVLRVVVLLWFVFELRLSTSKCPDDDKVTFMVHFGAGFLVWFVFVPILGIIAPVISPLWRFKIILGIDLLADLVSLCLLVHLFWPRSANRKYFLISNGDVILSHELDDFERTLIDNQSDSDDDININEGPIVDLINHD